jgi:exopolysaccharide production protein ExoQ
MEPAGRARVLFAAVVIAIPLAFLALQFAGTMTGNLLELFGKNATLTGRTELWQYAFGIIPDHPFLGVGFQAFWVQEMPQAEALWARFFMPGRSGFHFHSTFVEFTVELGLIGAAILAYLLAASILLAWRWSWSEGSVPAAFFFAFLILVLLRSFVEVDMPLQFDFPTYLWFIAFTTVQDRTAASRRTLANIRNMNSNLARRPATYVATRSAI